jgi:YbbR domain-containing protein
VKCKDFDLIKYKYHIVIVSLILSALLWVSLNLNQIYEIDKSIPVKINITKPYAVTGNIPLFLDVKFRGPGWSLLRLFTSLNPEFNYNVIPRLNEKTVILTRQYLNDNLGLSQNLSITDVYPESLYVMVDKYEEKFVKLVPKLKLDFKNGYQMVGRPVLEPDSIKIGGASKLLSSLKLLTTQEVNLNNVNATFSKVINVTDSLSNVIWKPESQIKLTVNVELTAEKELPGVTIKVSDIPADKEVLLIPENVTLQLKGGVKQLSSLDASKIIAMLNYNEIFADTTGSVVPRFNLPEGISLIFMKPEKIQYVIKKKF